jgi:hypothetical protein
MTDYHRITHVNREINHSVIKITCNCVTYKTEENTPKCKRHDQLFTFYCHTCTCLLCQICLTNKHKKHDCSLLDEAVALEIMTVSCEHASLRCPISPKIRFLSFDSFSLTILIIASVAFFYHIYNLLSLFTP